MKCIHPGCDQTAAYRVRVNVGKEELGKPYCHAHAEQIPARRYPIDENGDILPDEDADRETERQIEKIADRAQRCSDF
jgi:hypothetical protein